jgi:hypothetical protein
MKKTFSSSFDFAVRKDKVQVYGEEIQKIADEHGGQVKPINVVDKARDKKSALHDYFEWDDSIAAERFRIAQARNLINHIEVTILFNDEERKSRAFFNVSFKNEDDNKDSAYIPVEIVANTPGMREQLIDRALDEVKAWKNRWHEYKELAEIFGAIEETQKRLFGKK